MAQNFTVKAREHAREYDIAHVGTTAQYVGVRDVVVHMAAHPYAIPFVRDGEWDTNLDPGSGGWPAYAHGPNGMRAEQDAAAMSAFRGFACRNTAIVMSCGSGKTLVGVAIASLACKRPTLVVARDASTLRNWADHFMRFCGLRESDLLYICSSEIGASTWRPTPVVLTTYETLASAQNAFWFVPMCTTRFGVRLRDEVHASCATKRAVALRNTIACVDIGLTATEDREDGRATEEMPVRFFTRLSDLQQSGSIATVHCVTWTTPGSDEKLAVAAKIVTDEVQAGHLVLLFCDRLTLLGRADAHLRALGLPVFGPLCGETSDAERARVKCAFEACSAGVLLLSEIGNEALNIPEARAGVDLHYDGSRPKFIQKLGRLQRAKRDGGSATMHTLVASHTTDAGFAARRDEYAHLKGYHVEERVAEVDAALLPAPAPPPTPRPPPVRRSTSHHAPRHSVFKRRSRGTRD